MPEAVLLNGTVGAGKSATALALSDLLDARGVRHAVIDVDQVRLLRPAPGGDPFQHGVAVANLADLAANYRRAGAERLIVAGVVEHPRHLAQYAQALGGPLRHVLLTVRHKDAAARLAARHADDAAARSWHLARTAVLTPALAALPGIHAVIDTSHRSPVEVAERVAGAIGW